MRSAHPFEWISKRHLIFAPADRIPNTEHHWSAFGVHSTCRKLRCFDEAQPLATALEPSVQKRTVVQLRS
jgi:hypothetical protein